MDEFATLSDLRLAAIDGGDDPGFYPFDEDHPQYGGSLGGLCIIS